MLKDKSLLSISDAFHLYAEGKKLSIRTKIAVFRPSPKPCCRMQICSQYNVRSGQQCRFTIVAGILTFNQLQILLENRWSLFGSNASQTVSLCSHQMQMLFYPPKPNE